MAVVELARTNKINVVVNTGTTTNPTYKNRGIGTGYIINKNLTDAVCYETGQKFGALQAHTVEKIQRFEKYELGDE